MYVCNVATQAGETAGYDVQDHVEALISHVGRDVFSVVVANGQPHPRARPRGAAPSGCDRRANDQSDYPLLLADLVDSQYPWRHDPAKLAQALIIVTEDKA